MALDKLKTLLGFNPIDDEEDYEDIDRINDDFAGEDSQYSYRSRMNYSRNMNAFDADGGYSVKKERRNSSPVRMILVKGKTFNESERIAENIRRGNSVIINMEEMPDGEAQRTVDFLTGATFAMKGTIQRLSASTFIFAVGDVDLQGRIKDNR